MSTHSTTIRARIAALTPRARTVIAISAAVLVTAVVVAIAWPSQASVARSNPAVEAWSAAGEPFSTRQRHDEDLVRRTEAALERVFGAGLAHVVVSSEWTYEDVDVVQETLDPRNRVVVSETTSKTTRPVQARAPSAPEVAAEAEAAPLSSESKRESIVGRSTETRKSHVPRLQRLSVSLFLDESQRSRAVDVERVVKSAVAFDGERGDTFASLVAPFAGVHHAADPEPTATPRASGWLAFVARHALELSGAAVLAFVLLRMDRRRRAAAQARQERGAELSPEARARARVDEVLRNDPARVGSILTRWANEADRPARAVPAAAEPSR